METNERYSLSFQAIMDLLHQFELQPFNDYRYDNCPAELRRLPYKHWQIFKKNAETDPYHKISLFVQSDYTKWSENANEIPAESLLGEFLVKKLGSSNCEKKNETPVAERIKINDTTNQPTIEKEKNMKTNFNFDFGPIKGDVRISMHGLAIKNTEGIYVSYDATNGSIIDVDILNFKSDSMLYKMPVAIKDIKTGDVIVHNKTAMFVTDVLETNKFEVVDVREGTAKNIIPTVNMFGFNFMTKVVSIMDMMGGLGVNDSSPFGNMLPFMMMNDNDSDIDPMMMMLMMQNQGGAMSGMNPMMMMLMQNKDSDDSFSKMLPMMMMMNGGNMFMAPAPVAPANVCTCGTGCTCHATNENAPAQK